MPGANQIIGSLSTHGLTGLFITPIAVQGRSSSPATLVQLPAVARAAPFAGAQAARCIRKKATMGRRASLADGSWYSAAPEKMPITAKISGVLSPAVL